MKKLHNATHEAYAQYRARGLNQTEAYTAARPPTKPRSKNSIAVSAANVEHRPEVQERIRTIQESVVRQNPKIADKTEIAELLSDALRRAASDDQLLSAAAGLADKLNRMFGYYEPERSEIEVGALCPADREAKLRRLIGGGDGSGA